MNQFLRYRDGSKSLLLLKPTTRKAFGRLAAHADAMFHRQNAKARRFSSVDCPDEVVSGAEEMTTISRAPGGQVVITPEQASEAFICCCFLTTEVENLPASLLRPLLNILWLMGDCFLVTIDVGVLPPIEDLPSTIKKNKLLAKLYPTLRSTRGKCDLSLADAARLVEILKPVSTVIALQMFRFECFYVSRGLIFALNLVEEAIP